MNREEIKTTALDVLMEIAPEVEAERLEPGVSFRDQFEFDSVDYLNFVLTLEKHLGIKIPEIDYPLLSSLDGCLSYLEPRLVVELN